LRIGGAAVSDRHANIVVASGDASGSDILALLETMRSRVLAQSGIRLELENRMLGASLSKSGSGSGSKERICQWPSDTRAWME
jgi:UDP-N-acetylenolpyruvoylglucosamine reductase